VKLTSEIINDYTNYELNFLQSNKDSILDTLLLKKVSPEIINSTVYACIEKKEFIKAVQWAQILNLYKIGSADYLDTLGEAYYNAGNIARAQSISNQLVALNSKFTNQFKEWEKAKQNIH
jgi:hypothetical protein